MNTDIIPMPVPKTEQGLSASERQEKMTTAMQSYMQGDNSVQQKQELEHYLPDYWAGGLLSSSKRGPVGRILQSILRWIVGA